MLQEVKVGCCLCLMGWEPFARGKGFLAETHVCGSSVQNDLAQERKKEKKRTAFGEEANCFRTKIRPFQELSCWESADFLPGIARLSLSVCSSSHCTAVAHQLFEALL